MDTEIAIGIRKVKLVGFFVNEGLYKHEKEEQIKYAFQHIIGLDVENNLLSFTLRAFYYYDDIGHDQKLIDIHVRNTFAINELAKRIVKNPLNNEATIMLTDLVWTIIASMSLAHTRAIMSTNISGTVYDHFIIPIVDPQEFAKKIFNLQSSHAASENI